MLAETFADYASNGCVFELQYETQNVSRPLTAQDLCSENMPNQKSLQTLGRILALRAFLPAQQTGLEGIRVHSATGNMFAADWDIAQTSSARAPNQDLPEAVSEEIYDLFASHSITPAIISQQVLPVVEQAYREALEKAEERDWELQQAARHQPPIPPLSEAGPQSGDSDLQASQILDAAIPSDTGAKLAKIKSRFPDLRAEETAAVEKVLLAGKDSRKDDQTALLILIGRFTGGELSRELLVKRLETEAFELSHLSDPAAILHQQGITAYDDRIRQLQERGWRFEVVERPLGTASEVEIPVALADDETKIIYLRSIASSSSRALSLVSAIRDAETLEEFASYTNGPLLTRAISKTLGLGSSVSEQARIERAFQFLAARERWLDKLEVYQSLREQHPEQRIAFLEDLCSQNGESARRQKLERYLSSTIAAEQGEAEGLALDGEDLYQDFQRLDSRRLAQIIAGLGGITGPALHQASCNQQRSRTPQSRAFFDKLDDYVAMIPERIKVEVESDRRAQPFRWKDVEEARRFLRDARVIRDPVACTRQLGPVPDTASIPTPPTVIIECLGILSGWDSLHHTNLAAEEACRALSLFSPSFRYKPDRQLLKALLDTALSKQQLHRGGDSELAVPLVNYLVNSPTCALVLGNRDRMNSLGILLRSAAQEAQSLHEGEYLLPRTDQVRMLYDLSIDLREARGRYSLEARTQAENLRQGISTCHSAESYFALIDDRENASHFAARRKALEALINPLLDQGDGDLSTPSAYGTAMHMVARIAAAVGESKAKTVVLNAEESDLLSELYLLSSDRAGIEALLGVYVEDESMRGQLVPRLRRELEELRTISWVTELRPVGDMVNGLLLAGDMPEIIPRWEALVHRGKQGTAVPATSQQMQPSAGGDSVSTAEDPMSGYRILVLQEKVDSESRVLRIAEEVFRAELEELAAVNSRELARGVESILLENREPSEIPSSLRARRIPRQQVDRAISLLIEREVLGQKLAAYERLHDRHPEIIVPELEALISEENREKALSMLGAQKLGIGADAAESLYLAFADDTVDSILRAQGATSRGLLDLKLRNSAGVEVDRRGWDLNDLMSITPSFIGSPERFEDHFNNRDLIAVIRFLTSPIVCRNPWLCEEYLQGYKLRPYLEGNAVVLRKMTELQNYKFSGDPELREEQAKRLRLVQTVRQNMANAIAYLREYDKTAGKDLACNFTANLLSGLELNAGMRLDREIMQEILRIVSEAYSPTTALQRLFNPLMDSPSVDVFIRDQEAVQTIAELLLQIDPAYQSQTSDFYGRPGENQVYLFFDRTLEHYLELGRHSPDRAEAQRALTLARHMTEQARRYYTEALGRCQTPPTSPLRTSSWQARLTHFEQKARELERE